MRLFGLSYFIMIACVLSVDNIYAQIRPLNVGETVPDFQFNDVSYYSSKSINLKDFRGKLVILDFWGPSCGSCIVEMPRMDELQKKYSDKIRVLPVISTRFSSKTEFKKEVDLKWRKTYYDFLGATSLPNIMDTILYKYFLHKGVPFQVWIDKDGKFLGRTMTGYASEKEIDKILSGQKPDWEIDYTYPYPVTKADSLRIALKIADSIDAGSLYKSTVSNPVRGIQSRYMRNPVIDSLPGFKIYRFINETLVNTLHIIHSRMNNMYYPHRFTIVETKDSSKYFNIENEPEIEWENTKGFCYNLKLPSSVNDKQAFDIIIADLEKAFDFKSGIEERRTPCYAVSKMNPKDFTGITRTDKTSTIMMKEFIGILNNEFKEDHPFICPENMEDSVLLYSESFNLTYKDIRSAKKFLNDNGYDFIKENSLVKMLVIRDNAAQDSGHLKLSNDLRKGVLPNGFTYYIHKNPEPSKKAYLYLVNKVGSILETEQQRGLAHFMEHMNFNGTKNFPKNTLIDYLEKSGVRFGADLNAYTGFDETVYQLPLPTGDPEVLNNGLRIIRDWAQEAVLDQEEIDKERGVVMEEKRLGKGMYQRIYRATLPILLNHSRYADRLPIGTDDVLLNFKRKEILDYYTDWYRPDLQAIIVVGDIDVDKIEASIKSMFGSLKSPAVTKPRTNYAVPLTGANQYIAVTDSEYPVTELEINIKHRELLSTSMPNYKQLKKRQLFNYLLNERLHEIVRKPDSPFRSGSVSMDPFLGGLDIFKVSVSSGPGVLEKSFKGIWSEIERVRRFGFTATEFERLKIRFINGLEITRKENKTYSESLVNNYVNHFLKGVISPDAETEYAILKDFYTVLTVEDINSLITGFVAEINRDIIITAPDSEKNNLPDEKMVNKWIQEARQSDIAAYDDSYNNTDLLTTLPIAGKTIRQKTISSVNVTEFMLSNGMRVVFKPTNFKKEQVIFNIHSLGGASLYPDKDHQTLQNISGLVTSSGVGKFKSTDLTKMLSGKSVDVRPAIGEYSEGIGGYSAPKDMETAMQLAHLYFTSPRKDTGVFNDSMKYSAIAIAGQKNTPGAVFEDTISAVLGGYSVRRTPPTKESLGEVNLDRGYEIYRERFANAADFTAVFVGDFNVDSMKLLVEKYLGSLPSKGKKEKFKDLGIRSPKGQLTKIVKKGSEELAVVRIVTGGDYKYNTINNLKLGALGAVLQLRVTERLREKDGEAYSPSASHGYSRVPVNRYSFTVSFGCAPGNADKMIAAVKEEIESIKVKGISKEELLKFTSERELRHDQQLKSNNVWLTYLRTQYENNENLSDVFEFKKHLASLTPAVIQEAAKQYLSLDNCITFMLLPE